MTTLDEQQTTNVYLALERAVFRWRPDSGDVNPFDEVGPGARLRLLTSVRWHWAYEVYLCSGAWRRVRKAALLRAGMRCERCEDDGLFVALEVHHRTYEHLGDEHDDELEALCADCHKIAERERRHATRRRRWWRS